MCRDPDNQFRFTASAERCHATHTLVTAQLKDRDNDEASARAAAWSAQLKPPLTQP